MTDLNAVLDRAGGKLDQLLATGGTTVNLLRGGDPAAAPINPATLAPAAGVVTTYGAGRAALVLEQGGGGDGVAARSAAAPDALVIVGRVDGALDDVRERDLVEVTACRDERLVGRRYVVGGVRGGSGGVALLLQATLVRT